MLRQSTIARNDFLYDFFSSFTMHFSTDEPSQFLQKLLKLLYTIDRRLSINFDKYSLTVSQMYRYTALGRY